MRNLLLFAILTVVVLFAVFAAPAGAQAQGCPYGSPCPVPPNSAPCGWGGVTDRGPPRHAQGYTQGGSYFVIFGDTLFSIGQRFCVSVDSLRSANGIFGVLAGQYLDRHSGSWPAAPKSNAFPNAIPNSLAPLRFQP